MNITCDTTPGIDLSGIRVSSSHCRSLCSELEHDTDIEYALAMDWIKHSRLNVDDAKIEWLSCLQPSPGSPTLHNLKCACGGT